jgi:hypothetical protein
MMDLKVSLDFACCQCAKPVQVLVRCSSKGIHAALAPVATVQVPCPNCGQGNQLTFEPNGLVHGVRPLTAPRHIPQPSLN